MNFICTRNLLPYINFHFISFLFYFNFISFIFNFSFIFDCSVKLYYLFILHIFYIFFCPLLYIYERFFQLFEYFCDPLYLLVFALYRVVSQPRPRSITTNMKRHTFHQRMVNTRKGEQVAYARRFFTRKRREIIIHTRLRNFPTACHLSYLYKCQISHIIETLSLSIEKGNFDVTDMSSITIDKNICTKQIFLQNPL